jgi:hypothetical protein
LLRKRNEAPHISLALQVPLWRDVGPFPTHSFGFRQSSLAESVFRVHQAALELVEITPCGGSEPIAVAQRGNLVYVVNAGGTSNVVGFYLGRNGKLQRIPNAIAFLTTANSGAASLSFSPDGGD